MSQSPARKTDVTTLDLNAISDEDLMRRYQTGEELAFETLYARHSNRIYGYLLTKLKDRILTDDIFQGTFLKLHRTRDQYDPNQPFLPWLFTICRSVMVDALRARSRVNDSESTIEETTLENDLVASVEPEADLITTGSVDFTRLPLSQDQKQALELRYVNEASFQDIADKLHTSPTNARQLVSRALQKMRRVFDRQPPKKGHAP